MISKNNKMNKKNTNSSENIKSDACKGEKNNNFYELLYLTLSEYKLCAITHFEVEKVDYYGYICVNQSIENYNLIFCLLENKNNIEWIKNYRFSLKKENNYITPTLSTPSSSIVGINQSSISNNSTKSIKNIESSFNKIHKFFENNAEYVMNNIDVLYNESENIRYLSNTFMLNELLLVFIEMMKGYLKSFENIKDYLNDIIVNLEKNVRIKRIHKINFNLGSQNSQQINLSDSPNQNKKIKISSILN
jgi:hypothetical protein